MKAVESVVQGARDLRKLRFDPLDWNPCGEISADNGASWRVNTEFTARRRVP